ncbi:polyprenol phosphate mannosyl transferase 1 (Ppm1) [Actinoplanes sp. NBRC 14428]|uniref:Glycosyltransferase involved in cell wall biosynthesis n=1 Tax=Pseudosporangium ferrugineum TaxID=439699 RepID=A0A2T0SF31_9ACTN|nr:glycosyltransferase family 2 protein [Pseudosporangium ferrugineum]PRY32026.1 glycosyltransferase involved in cell wall biosynthesis [Pseudosporangium ferrugineum]BCJ49735.1 polyprenol phosphate mannosyl transferase 1 (Ppm1) [Actinoplanes sp. NBRC 14428]
MRPRVSVVIPVYNEGDAIMPCMERILRDVLLPAEILLVHDTPDDTTVPYAQKLAMADPRVRPVLNTYGRGPANAIRFGIDAALAPVTVVTMADGCDDPRQIDGLARLVERGVVVAAASRYMPGGQQVGGPRLKRLMSRWAGLSLYHFTRVGTRDATNSFKAYHTDFVRQVGIESRAGFEIGLELTAKAARARMPVAELPTIWLDRQLGESHFDLGRFLPSYLRWYRFAFGRRLTMEQLAARRVRVEAAEQPVPSVALETTS